MNYDFSKSKEYCSSIGLFWDDEFANYVDEKAFKFGLSQEQFDEIAREYMDRLKFLWTPQNYSWKNRIKIAIYWLIGG